MLIFIILIFIFKDFKETFNEKVRKIKYEHKYKERNKKGEYLKHTNHLLAQIISY